jgi:hypothetical protein
MAPSFVGVKGQTNRRSRTSKSQLFVPASNPPLRRAFSLLKQYDASACSSNCDTHSNAAKQQAAERRADSDSDGHAESYASVGIGVHAPIVQSGRKGSHETRRRREPLGDFCFDAAPAAVLPGAIPPYSAKKSTTSDSAQHARKEA